MHRHWIRFSVLSACTREEYCPYYDATSSTNHVHSIQHSSPMSMQSPHLLRDGISIVNRPDTTPYNDHYVSNEHRLPQRAGQVAYWLNKTWGWLLEYLNRQRAGLTGNLGETSVWLQKENNTWLSKNGRVSGVGRKPLLAERLREYRSYPRKRGDDK